MVFVFSSNSAEHVSQQLSKIYEKLGGDDAHAMGGRYVLKCEKPSDAPDIVFTLGGRDWNIPYRDIMYVIQSFAIPRSVRVWLISDTVGAWRPRIQVSVDRDSQLCRTVSMSRCAWMDSTTLTIVPASTYQYILGGVFLKNVSIGVELD
jgi:hypothetical protein